MISFIVVLFVVLVVSLIGCGLMLKFFFSLMGDIFKDIFDVKVE